MTYRIEGLDPAAFQPLFGLSDEELVGRGMKRVRSDGRGFPCRVSLEDAEAGERLILLNHVSQPADTPYRASHAILVREGAKAAAVFVDEPAPVMQQRVLSLRGFDGTGMLLDSRLAMPGEADAKIRELLADLQVAEIHAHNAGHGCFSARIVRE